MPPVGKQIFFAFSFHNRYDVRMKNLRFVFGSAIFTLLTISAVAENTATIPAPLSFPTNWMSQHETFMAQAKQGGIDLLFLGDSITAGWKWTGWGLNIWNKIYAPLHAADFGIGYNRTQNVLWQIDHGELAGIHPKVVVLLIGTNNMGNEDNGKPRNSLPEIVEGVTAIVNDVRGKLSHSKVLLIGVFPRGHQDDPIREQVKELNAQIAKLADGKMVRFLDINSKLIAADGTISANFRPDLLHPKEQGYQIWADTMQSTLDEMMK
jgi:lysophospholipase L1-like esterase